MEIRPGEECFSPGVTGAGRSTTVKDYVQVTGAEDFEGKVDVLGYMMFGKVI